MTLSVASIECFREKLGGAKLYIDIVRITLVGAIFPS